MANRNEVIRGLECCAKKVCIYKDTMKECPYHEMCDEFFEDRVSSMVPVLPAGLHVLEVKYDEFLPDFIAKQLEIGILRQTAFSKYYLGRMAINGEFPTDR